MSHSGTVIPGDYVFSDPIAFRHLAQEEGTEIVEENTVVNGYQVYIVEQWACSRVHPVFVVTTFTGEESNQVFIEDKVNAVNGECIENIERGHISRSIGSLFRDSV
jgi:hypothetical protein